jgi:hypothetical protein
MIFILFLFDVSMKSMKDSLIQQCLDILKRDEVKNDLKLLIKPIIYFILYEISPYIYVILLFVFILFLMILAILILLIILLRNHHSFMKNL